MGKSSSSPQPVNPYQAAGAQYGLNTGTAAFNAALNRTGAVNPVGASGWQVTGYSGGGPPSSYGAIPGTSTYNPGGPPGGNTGGFVDPYSAAGGPAPSGAGAPLYQFQENLAPGFDAAMRPLDTSEIYGGGPGSPQAGVGGLPAIQNALYNQQAGYFMPEQQLQTEQMQSELANSGIPVGSTAYNNAMSQLGRQQTFQQQQAANSAITGATGQEAQLQNIALQGLGAQQAAGEYGPQLFSMMSGGQSPAYAGNSDILGAFQNQYQGQLNAANASNAANNQEVGDAASLAAMAALYFM